MNELPLHRNSGCKNAPQYYVHTFMFKRCKIDEASLLSVDLHSNEQTNILIKYITLFW